jgi:hypothetical protein
MEEIKRIDEGRRWDNLIWALALASLLVGISFGILEILGFFGEIGIVGLIIGGAFALFLGMLNTARILKRMDSKTTNLCQTMTEESVNTRREIPAKIESDGEKTREILAEIRDLLKGGK